jgi:UPF0716 protein FxsA
MRGRVSLVGVGLLVTVVAEIVAFVLVAHWIGVGLTILLVLATSLLGAWMLRNAGLRAWRGLRDAGMTGQRPGPEVTQGLLGLLSGVLLVLPGFLTDLVGVALLAPPVRRVAGRGAQRVVERRVSSAAAGTLFGPRRVRVYTGGPPSEAGPVEGEPIEGEIVDR